MGDVDDTGVSHLLLILMLPQFKFTDRDTRDILSLSLILSLNPVDVIQMTMVQERFKERLGSNYPHVLHAARVIANQVSWLRVLAKNPAVESQSGCRPASY